MTETQIIIMLLIAILLCLSAVGVRIVDVIKDQTQVLREFKSANIHYTKELRDTADKCNQNLDRLRRQGDNRAHI